MVSTIPPYTPPAWTSILTGVNPGWHGIYSFIKYTHGIEKLNTSFDVKFPRLFEMLAMNGLKSVVINVPFTYPFNALICRDKYVVVSDWASPVQSIWPQKLQSKYGEYLVKPPHGFTLERSPSNHEMSVKDYVNRIHEYLKIRINLYYELFDEYDWSLFFIVFSETDWLLHRIPELLRGKAVNIAQPVFNLIRGFIEHVCERCNLTLIMSDHGFEHKRLRVNVNAFLASKGLLKYGYAIGKSTSSKRLFGKRKRGVITLPVRRLLRILPTNITSILKGAFIGEILRASTLVDLRRSVAFMGESGSWSVYVPKGSYIEQVSNVLKTVPGVSKVVKARNVYRGPYVSRGPQLITIPRKRVELTNGLHGDIVKPINRGGHEVHGVLAAMGDYEVEPNKIFVTVFDIRALNLLPKCSEC